MSANLALTMEDGDAIAKDAANGRVSGDTVTEKKKQLKVEMKTYQLKEVDALRKKLGFADINPAIALMDEATNGSCISVELKTSLFELMKQRWIGDIKEMEGIDDIIPITKAVAGTINFGKVDVEFTLEASFTINGVANKVKVKCYPTKCKMTVTHMVATV